MKKKMIKETYTVSLTFTDIDSDNPLEAVKKIIGWIKDNGVDNMIFDVIGEITNDKFTVDMSEDEENAVLPNKNKFNVMKGLNITQIKDKLKLLGLITNEGKPISYSSFKNKASVHRYGKKYKIVFIGIPKTNLFGFYTMYNTNILVMKEAYSLFLELVNDNIEPYTDKDVQWTNRGIPLIYSKLSISFDEVND